MTRDGHKTDGHRRRQVPTLSRVRRCRPQMSTFPHDRRRHLMHKSLLIAGVVGALALPSAALADDTPTSGDVTSASQQCRTERGTTAATREAFSQRYGTNKNKSNAFGKCVSKKSREEMQEREDADQSASQTCKTERGTTAATREAFN